MKRKFTLLIAALALLTMMASTGTALGQSDYSSDYTGNITLSTAGGTNASDCVIAISGTNYAGIKAGTSSKVGAVVVTVPSGTKYLHIHAAAWNGTTASLAVTPDGYSENIALTANSGIANNSPFTFNGDPSTSDYYKVITFSDALTANTNLTFTAVGGKRFVIWGVTSEEAGSSTTPSITASNVDIAYDATNGSIAYEINNPVNGGALTATTTAEWLTLGTVDETTVPFTCGVNPAATERAATVTLTYTYNTDQTVTKNVTVTQAGNPNVVDNIEDITATGSYTVQGTIVAISNRGFILGDGTGYVYYYYGSSGFTPSNYAIGDKKKLSGSVTVYGGVYQFGSSTTITTVETSNYTPENPTILTGTQMDTRVASTTPPQLSDYIQYQGKLSVSGTYYNITDIEGATTAKGSISYPTNTDFTSLNGKTVTVTGYYVGISSSTYYNTMIGSIEEVETEVAAPTFSPAAGTYATTQEVTISCETDGATIYYTTDGTEPTNESTEYTEELNVTTTTTFKAIAIKGNDESTVTTATYHINSQANPYTVAQALAFYEYPANGIYVHGIVSTAPTAAPNNGQLTYYISADGTATNQLQVYKGKGLNEANFTAQDDIQVGDIVTVYGNVIIYGTTNPIKEFAQNNYLVSFERPEVPAISVEPATVNATAAETDGTLQVAYTAIASDRGITWYTDQTAATIANDPEWILADINATTLYVDYIIAANDGAARTAYMKVHGKSAANDVIYSNLVTINQSEYIAPTPSIAVTPTLVEATADETQGTITVTLTAIANNEIEVQWFESDGTTAATYNHDWVLTDVNTDKNIDYVIGANTGAARTAYFKVYGMDGEANDVYSELVTINQAAPVTPPTTDNYELFSGALVEGDYIIYYEGSAMKNTISNNRLSYETVTPENDVIITDDVTIVWHIAQSGDYWTIYSDEAEAYAASTGTKNQAQMLSDGTDDKALWSVTGTETYNFVNKYNANASVNAYLRNNVTTQQNYGFACYAEGTGGALSLYKKADNTPSITINPGPYNLNSEGGDAVLPVTYTNMPTDPQADVIFYESDGETIASYDWITANINGDGNVAGHIDANTGAARSAYFKVKGINANNNPVYSDLVTINQAAYTLSIVFTTTSLDIEAGGEQGRVISFEYEGLGENPTFEVRTYDASGETQTTYDWLETSITDVHKVSINVAANTGDARSAYFKVYGENGTVNTESNLVTINQAEYVAPTYTVTYDANGGLGTMTDPNSPYVANTEVTLLENTFTAPEGMKWDAWLVQDANQTAIEVNDGKFIMPASNVTVTAQWVDDPYAPTYEWVLTALEDLTSNDVFVIVGTRDNTNYYGMSTDKGTSTQPEAVEVTIANNKLSASPADRIKWNLTGDNSTGYIFYPNGSSTTWLYCNTTAASSSNTNMRVGDGDRKLFIFDDNNYMVTNDDYTDRYVSLNGSTDWRGYVNTNQATTITFYKRQVASTDPQLSANDVNIASDETEGEITYTLENPVSGGILTAEITEGDWLTLGTVGENNVPFTCSANTEQTERTATVTLTYSYGENSIYATAVVTQAALVIDFATLPFEFNGGRADIENTVGLTQEGLDSDYGSSPKLKFNSTDDWMILKLNEAPKSLSYDIKGNGFSGGTFTVQTSANGTDYYDLATYTELGDLQSITHVDLDASVHYIKWIYTNKKTGNVALGNIHATKHYDTYGDVTLNDLNLTASSESLIVHSGSVVTLTGTVTNDSPDNLVIEDGGQLIHTGDVQATLLKDYDAAPWPSSKGVDGWYTIASPVNGANVSVVTTTANYDFYKYDEAEYKWLNQKVAAHGITTFEQGVGYLYATSEDKQGSFAGTMKATNANIEKDLSYACTVASLKGFNLMGNPFTRNLTNGDVKLGDSYLTTYYVVEGGSELVARQIDTYPIKPGQGFMVQATAENQKLVFNPGSAKGHSANNGYISIAVGNESFNDMAYINVANGNTLRKMTLNADGPKVYVMNNNLDYAAARVEGLSGSMPVCFQTKNIGTYTITIQANKLDVEYLHLIDNVLHEDIDMLLEPSYSFIASGHDYAARFTLVFKANANIDEIEVNDNFAYQNGSDIIVNGNGELQVFDVTGRMVMNTKINGIQTVNVPATGMYIFRMVGESVQTQKIVVR